MEAILKKAVDEGDANAIIAILAKQKNEKLVALGEEYKKKYGKTLDEALSEAGSFEKNFCLMVAALIKRPVDFAADELHWAMKGLGTDEDALIDILCTQEAPEIKKFKDAFNRKYKPRLRKWIDGDTGGDFRLALVDVLDSNRGGNPGISAQQDAQNIYAAGQAVWGTDEDVIIKIIALRSFPHIREIVQQYKKQFDKSLEDALNYELSGALRRSLLAIVQSAIYPPKYYAERLYNSLSAWFANDDRAVIFVIVSRYEIDMRAILEAYQKIGKTSLLDDIKSCTSGQFRDLLLAVINANK